MTSRNRLTAILALIFALGLFLTACAKEFPETRYIFIDGGSYLGETITKFKKTDLYSRYPWELFAIEANPDAVERIPQSANLKVLNKAVWIEEGSVEFHVHPDRPNTSNLFAGPVSITVESMDFGQWLKRNFSKSDYIIVNFDICGAEYDVLSKMIAEGTVVYIDRLYVGFHPATRGESNYIASAKRLIAKIIKYGIIVVPRPVVDIIDDGDWSGYYDEL